MLAGFFYFPTIVEDISPLIFLNVRLVPRLPMLLLLLQLLALVSPALHTQHYIRLPFAERMQNEEQVDDMCWAFFKYFKADESSRLILGCEAHSEG